MDHHAVAQVQADVVRSAAAESPIEDEVAGLQLIHWDVDRVGPLGTAVMRQLDAGLEVDPSGETGTIEGVGAGGAIGVGGTELGPCCGDCGCDRFLTGIGGRSNWFSRGGRCGRCGRCENGCHEGWGFDEWGHDHRLSAGLVQSGTAPGAGENDGRIGGEYCRRGVLAGDRSGAGGRRCSKRAAERSNDSEDTERPGDPATDQGLRPVRQLKEEVRSHCCESVAVSSQECNAIRNISSDSVIFGTDRLGFPRS